jgi:hypothetical protein
MATTTNFGWVTPDDTSLVKDGAAAIRTLGQSIDTSMMDLEGGTTGQVLSKASNTDMDFTWVTTDDANAIQNAIVDAKGDLIAATAADTPARLAVGANNTVLTADSSTATGLKWATPAAGTPTFAGCVIMNNGSITLSNATTTTLTFDAEHLDTDGFHSTATNTSRITIPSGKAGKYLVLGTVRFDANNTGRRISRVLKNGATLYEYEMASPTNSVEASLHHSSIVSLAEGDYIEITAWQNSGGNLVLSNNGSLQYSTFSAYLIGA